MNRKPSDISTKTLAHNRQLLAEWLAEWELDRILRDEALPGQARSGTKRDGTFSYDHAPDQRRPGEVGLLHPRHDAENEYPLYVLVLAEEGERLLLSPFSRFATPALPGEFRTGLRAEPLRVLCLWNARWVTRNTLCPMWVARTVPERILAEARTVYQGLTDGGSIPAELARKCGPPLSHPGDPRRNYMEEERTRVDRIESRDSATDQSVFEGRGAYLADDDLSEEALPLAAEARWSYAARSRVYRVLTLDALLLVRSAGEGGGEAWLRTESGGVCARADGGRIVATDGQHSAPIHEGWASIVSAEVSEIQDADGVRHAAQPYRPGEDS